MRRMNRKARPSAGRQGGFAMIAVLLTMALMLGMNAAFHGGILSDTKLRGAHAVAVSGFYAAEAGINRGMAENVNVFKQYNQPTDFSLHSFALDGRQVKYQLNPVSGYANGVVKTVEPGKPFQGLNSIHYRYIAQASSEKVAGDTEVNLGTEFDVNYIPLFQFLAFYQGDLEISPGPTMTLHGPIHTNGSLYMNSNNTLTIADMVPQIQAVQITAAGDVWRGRKDSTACSGTVRISKLTTTTNHTTALPLQNMNCSGANRIKQTDAQLATWLGSIKQRQPTVTVPEPSVLNRPNGTVTAGEFWKQANLRIVLNLNDISGGLARIEAQDINGGRDTAMDAKLQAFMTAQPGRIFYNDVPKAGGTPTATNGYTTAFATVNQIYPCPRTSILGLCNSASFWNTCTAGGADLTAPSCPAYQSNSTPSFVTSRRGAFKNNRENRYVYMLNVNLHDLLQWNRAQTVANQLFPPDVTTNGGVVIFLSVLGPKSVTGPTAASDPAYGVRVYGTPNFDFPTPLPADPTGVTIISDQAAYVEGDYNVDVGHPLYDATHPKMPAAIMADTINVLSQNWSGAVNGTGFSGGCRNDCQSTLVLASRPTRSTTINAAFLGGMDTTTTGNYNGGLENYPRFHEAWTLPAAATLTYRGSFVTLGAAQRSNGPWCGTGTTCNIYEAPVRGYDFDTTFQSVAWLPPLTPRVVSVQQVLFTENFR